MRLPSSETKSRDASNRWASILVISAGGRAGAATGRQASPLSGWRNERRVASTRLSLLGRNVVRIPTVSTLVNESRCTMTNCRAVWGENCWPFAGTISRSTVASAAKPPLASRRRSSSSGLRFPRADQRASRIDVLPELFSPTRYVVPGARSSRTSLRHRKPRTTTRETRMPRDGLRLGRCVRVRHQFILPSWKLAGRFMNRVRLRLRQLGNGPLPCGGGLSM